MEINLKSTAGRAFSALFDPITVSRLIDLAIADNEQRIRISLSSRTDRAKHDETPGFQESLDVMWEVLPFKFLDPNGPEGADSYSPSVMEAFRNFLGEFRLLQTGSGSERACMESFWTLCELLQG